MEFGSFWGVDSYFNIGHTVLVIDMPVTCTLSFSWLYAITCETILINTGLLPNFETGTIVPFFLWSNSKISDKVHGSNLIFSRMVNFMSYMWVIYCSTKCENTNGVRVYESSVSPWKSYDQFYNPVSHLIKQLLINIGKKLLKDLAWMLGNHFDFIVELSLPFFMLWSMIGL